MTAGCLTAQLQMGLNLFLIYQQRQWLMAPEIADCDGEDDSVHMLLRWAGSSCCGFIVMEHYPQPLSHQLLQIMPGAECWTSTGHHIVRVRTLTELVVELEPKIDSQMGSA